VIYFDTNVLVYLSINQDEQKQKKAKEVLAKAIKEKKLFLSSLVLSEFIFVLSKLKILNQQKEKVEFFSKFVFANMNYENVLNAYKQCSLSQKCKNINDFIHFDIASKYCDKLVTFDNDFKKLIDNKMIKIELLT